MVITWTTCHDWWANGPQIGKCCDQVQKGAGLISINTVSRLFNNLSVASSSPNDYDALSDLNLSPDDVVKGRVLKQFAPGDILLSIRGKQIRAHTKVPLREGMRISLKLSLETSVPTLKLIDVQASQGRTVNLAAIHGAIDDNIWSRVYEALDDSVLSSKDRNDIKTLMEKISQMLLTRPGGEGLKALIDASGFTWENKLAQILTQTGMTTDIMDALTHGDLKGLISKVLMETKGSDTVLNTMISALDNIQLLNIHGNDKTQMLFLPLPLQFIQGTMGMAQLLLQFPREDPSQEGGGGKDRQYRVVMLLELSTLGAIRAELLLNETKLQGRFLVEQENALECIEIHIPFFMDTLQERGFTIGHMGCQLVESAIVKQSLVNEIFPQEGSSICVVA